MKVKEVKAIEKIIREQITPKGDGNFHFLVDTVLVLFIREQITPKGDGNLRTQLLYM